MYKNKISTSSKSYTILAEEGTRSIRHCTVRAQWPEVLPNLCNSAGL